MTYAFIYSCSAISSIAVLLDLLLVHLYSMKNKSLVDGESSITGPKFIWNPYSHDVRFGLMLCISVQTSNYFPALSQTGFSTSAYIYDTLY